jgi:hypothetical protein
MSFSHRPEVPTEELPSYYSDLGDDNVRHRFRDFDVPDNFSFFDRQMLDSKSHNFCLDFGEDSAFCAFDLDAQSYEKLLTSPRPADLHTRWINIWMPSTQKDLLGMLARHFDFTPRLLGILQGDPVPARSSTSLRSQKSSSTLRSKLSFMTSKSNKSNSINERATNANGASPDSEESIGMTDLMHSTQLEMVQNLSHYQMIDDVWHWSTVDQGRRCKYGNCV